MAELNPYAKYLGGSDPVSVIAATTGRLEVLMRALPGEAASKPPRPGKWSAREILCHLADSEIVFAFRLRQALAQDHHVIQPFDQEVWAGRYAAYTVDRALEQFRATRAWNLDLIRAVTPQDMRKELTHPERGTMAYRVLVETMAGHDLNHLGLIEALRPAP